MNTDQFQSLLRQAITVISSSVVVFGHVDPTAVTTYAGSAGVIASVIWSLFAHAK